MDLSAIKGSTTEEVRVSQNVAGRLDPVLTVDPLEGRFVRINNGGGRGTGTGLPIYADLVDTNGNQMPVGTRLALGYKSQTAENFEVVSEVHESIIPYREYSVPGQQDPDHVDQVKHDMDARYYEVPYVDEFYLLLESDQTLDPNASTIVFEPNYIEDGPTGAL